MDEVLHSESYSYYLPHFDGFAFVVVENEEEPEEGETEGDRQGDPERTEQSGESEDIGEGAEPTGEPIETAEPTAEPAETAEPSASPEADYSEILESMEGIQETLTEVRDVGAVCVCAIGFCIGTIIIKNLFEELMRL